MGQELLTFPEHTSIVSFNINTNGATSGTGTANLSAAVSCPLILTLTVPLVGQELLTFQEHTSIVSFNINTNGATSGTGTTNLSAAYEYRVL